MAGVTGAINLVRIITGFWQIGMGHAGGSPIVGGPTVFNQTKVWERLNLDNDEELTKYIMETIRLKSVVSCTHRVASKDFNATINGHTQVFPKGTPIAIPLGLANLDRAFWGGDVFE